MTGLVLIVVFATAMWVGADASSMHQRMMGERIGGINAFLWFMLCIVLWIVAFPSYLVKRADAQRAMSGLAGLPAPPFPAPPGIPQGWWLASDGRWYPPIAQSDARRQPATHSSSAG